MLEDKDIGLKVAANDEEAFWTKIRDEQLKMIETIKREIIINSAIVELAERKMRESSDLNMSIPEKEDVNQKYVY